MRILLITDTHLRAGGAPHGVVPTTERLDAVVAHAASHLDGLPVDLVVMGGDTSDDGSADSYARARDALAPLTGAPVVWVPGNHDQRRPFREGIGSEWFLDGGGDEPVVSLLDVDGTRVVGLDTSVPGMGYGFVDDGQLAWLREVLAAPAPRGTVLVLHHPIAPPPSLLHEALRLANTEEVRDAIAGTDVRLMLSGHYHLPGSWDVGGATSVVGRAVTNQKDPSTPPDRERAVWRSGYTVLELGEGVRVEDVVVPHPRDGEQVGELDPGEALRVAHTEGRPGWHPA